MRPGAWFVHAIPWAMMPSIESWYGGKNAGDALESGAQTTIDIDEYRRGVAVEMEHGSHDPRTNVTHDDPLVTGKIAWAHLNEFPDYYTRLAAMEAEAKQYWVARRGTS